MKNVRLCKTTVEQKDDGIAPIIQVQYLTQVKNAVNASQYGIHCSPDLDTPCLLITINNDPANSYVLPLSFLERKNLVSALKKGEVVVGNFKKNATILFNESGAISVSTKKDLNVDVSGNLTANVVGTTTINTTGNVSITGGKVTLGPLTIIDGRIFLEHTHPAGTPPGNTGQVN
jgi:hypothetical protein